MDYRPLPVGVDNFEKLMTNGYYFVDKSLLIKDFLDKKGDVSLFTRPRVKQGGNRKNCFRI